MAVVGHVRKGQPRHAQHAVDVRVQDRLVLDGRLPERVATEREAGVVEEDVDEPELRGRPADEGGCALLVRDVEREGEVGVDALDAPRSARDARRLAELPGRSLRRCRSRHR